MVKITDTEIETIANAEKLIQYAAETIADAQKQAAFAKATADIESCRASKDDAQWDAATATKLWTSYNALCALVSPVSRDTLVATRQEVPSKLWWAKADGKTTLPKRAVNRYMVGFVVLLALCVVLTFMTSSIASLSSEIATTITANDKNADEIARQLSDLRSRQVADDTKFGTLKDKDALATAGKVSSALPLLYANADRLHSKAAYASFLVREKYPTCDANQNPDDVFCYKKGNGGVADTIENAQANIDNYRLTARRSIERADRALQVANFINQTMLPVFLGMLGACAYIIRTISEHIRNASYSSTSNIRNFVRFALGALAGVAIGFGGLFTGSTLSAVALSFLAGYSIEPVFAALDGIANKLK
ncbi:MAG: hypothetical protein EON54_10430 [Alcaligenaceae bacterium]|nr:MAG: hypothetical protein EON54_10430 [Alcaligenaceae bacterium]